MQRAQATVILGGVAATAVTGVCCLLFIVVDVVVDVIVCLLV